MTPEQRRVVRRFRRLVKDAKSADLILAVDAHAWGLRFIPREQGRTADDLGEVGTVVQFEDEPCDLSKGEVVGTDSCCGTPVTSSHPVM